MSDIMRPIPFNQLLSWILTEYREKGSIFGIKKTKFYRPNQKNGFQLFGESISTPIGPAAGPHTQLAQNIISSYLTGARFIELKTVQTLDGEDLPVSKPCILAADEAYNVEWSTELRVEDAFNEYVKAWIILHVLMVELEIANKRDFLFNMSVGYDLAGIQSVKIDSFIEGLKDASKTKIWKECITNLKQNMSLFTHFNDQSLKVVSAQICSSITLSTLHGCPKDEIEKISHYLLIEKHLHTFIKMNPTLLGEKFVRTTLNELGYDYITLNPHHFIHDLQFPDAIEMVQRLKEIAQTVNLEMGVKLSNTLPVRILNQELPGEEMYMSGKSLYPLTLQLALKFSETFHGDLRISYSGGIDDFNFAAVCSTGIYPLTFATTLLKPGGYMRIYDIAKSSETIVASKINLTKLATLVLESKSDMHHTKQFKRQSRKLQSTLQPFDCAIAPCSSGCPIHQQIPEYLALIGEGKFKEAFQIIVKDNATPSITGSICDHTCQTKCTRIDYEESLKIREMKKYVSQQAQRDYTEHLVPSPFLTKKTAVIIGAGPAGLGTAFYLRRNGMHVTVLEKREKPFGTVQYLIPSFRIKDEDIQMDYQLIQKMGVNVQFGVNEVVSIAKLKKQYDYVILAMGASVPISLDVDGKEAFIDAHSFLERTKQNTEYLKLGEHVVVIGAGDVAMDVARVAKRMAGVTDVSIVYRRTKEEMPASAEEYFAAMEEGIIFKECRAPLSYRNGEITCQVMTLGEKDEKGRRTPISTGDIETIQADQVIVAIGSTVDSTVYHMNDILVNEKGFARISRTGETNLENVYVAGDLKQGPATIAKALADGRVITQDILQKEGLRNDFQTKFISYRENDLYERKGHLIDTLMEKAETKRCLSCGNICELCVDVCPNRANQMIRVNGTHQIIHLDGMCNECGNCGVFCPHIGNPYQDKITIFWSEQDFLESKNSGFVLIDEAKQLFKVRTESKEELLYTLGEESISKDLRSMIETCLYNYHYLLG